MSKYILLSKYILYCTTEDPQDDMVLECDNAQEAIYYKHKMRNLGYKVEIRRIKNDC